MIGEDDIKDLEDRISSPPVYNPLNADKSHEQQVREWQKWSAQRQFIDSLKATIKNRSEVERTRAKKAERAKDRASVALRKPGLQIN